MREREIVHAEVSIFDIFQVRRQERSNSLVAYSILNIMIITKHCVYTHTHIGFQIVEKMTHLHVRQKAFVSSFG